MATDTRNFSNIISDDATFRTWGSSIAAALAACGLVKTADTGQIDWATVLKPSAVTTAAGYEIYRFNDTLQATRPVYLKVEYGTASIAATRTALWLTVGTGTNGAGTITGQASTRRQMAANSSTNGGVRTTYTSGDGSRIAQMGDIDSSGSDTLQPRWWAVGRTHDASGTPTGDGVVVFTTALVGNYAYQVVPFAGGTVPGVSTAFPGADPGAGSMSSFGTDVGLATPQIFIGKALYTPLLVVGRSVDLGSGSFTAVVLGATRTYLASAGLTGQSAFSGLVAAATTAIRWE